MKTLLHGRHPMMPLLLAACLVMLLAGAAALWPSAAPQGDDARIASLALLQHAYDKVEPGRTSQPELVRLGFDTARLKARSMSGLGVQEYFMPRTSAQFDLLDPAVRACFEGPDRCTVLVFPLAAPQGGLMAAHAAAQEQGRMVFLLKSGRVAYKAIVRN